jgi:WD40 repeat protein
MSSDSAQNGSARLRRTIAGSALLLGLMVLAIAGFAQQSGRDNGISALPDDPALAGLPKLQVGREFATPGPIASMIWSSDGTKLATANLGIGADIPGLMTHLSSLGGNRITIWDVDGHLLRTLRRPDPFFGIDSSFAFVAGDRQIAATTLDSNTLAFSVFDVDSGEIVHEVAGIDADDRLKRFRAKLIVASPDQSILAAGFPGGRPVALYSPQDWTRMAEVPIGQNNETRALAFSRDGRFLAIGTLYNALVYDLQSRDVVQKINPNFDGAIQNVAFSPDGTMLAVGGAAKDQPVRVFAVKDASRTAAFSTPDGPIGGLSWSPDGRLIAFVTGYRRLHLWEPFRPGPRERTVDLSSGAHSLGLALSPDGGTLAAEIEQNVRLFNLTR